MCRNSSMHVCAYVHAQAAHKLGVCVEVSVIDHREEKRQRFTKKRRIVS